MGCVNSKPPAAAPASSAAPEKVEPKVDEALPAKQEEPQGTPFVKKPRHHADLGVIMCPYFKVTPDEFTEWKKNCDAFYKAAQETENLIAYSMAFNDGGVHIRQGYRNAEALLQHLRTADKPMTDALAHSTLEKVEVHGPRKQLDKIKKQMTKVGDCFFDFCYSPHNLKNFRRPTEYAGKDADKLIHFDVSVEVSVEVMKTVKAKVKELHRHTRDNNGNESFSVSYNVEKGMLYLMASFDAAEALMDHFFSLQAELGAEIWANCKTQLFGPDSDVQKLKTLLSKTGEAAKKTLTDMAKAGASDVKAAKAYVESASKAAQQGLTDAVKESREAMKTAIDAVQDKAEELAKEVYKKAMSVEGAVKENAKAMSKAAYKRAMSAAHELRQDADQAAISAYSAAMQAGATVQDALVKAKEAAKAAAESLHDDIKGAKEAAEAALDRAKQALAAAAEAEKAALQDALKKAEQELDAATLAFEVNVKVFENALGEAATKARESIMDMWDGIKNTAQEMVDAAMAKEVETKTVTVEYVELVKVRARDAAWTVLIAKQHVYLVTYETQVSMRKSVEDAVAAAKEAADVAADKALSMFRRGEELAGEAVKAVEALVAKAGQAAEAFWNSTTTFVLDTEKSLRYTLHKAAATVLQEVEDAAFEVQYRVNSIVEVMEDEAEEMHSSIQARIESWWDAIVEAEVKALRNVADAADKAADKKERTKKVCC